ncbi:MAG: hypothetical protein QM723_08615 [Myxococcaceae bacterium]
MNPFVFGDTAANALVVAHALVGVVLAGASGHLGWLALARLRGKDVAGPRVVRHLVTIGCTLGLALLLGLLAYPHYRVHIREGVLDREFPWASKLFELKEHAGALASPLWVAAFGLERSSLALKPAAWINLLLSLLVIFTLVAGLIVTAVRGA